MKIGRIDITIPMLAYVAAISVGIIVLFVMWTSRAELRSESYYRRRILQAMNGDDPAAGLEACDSLLKSYPDKAVVCLFRANLLYRQGRYKDAEAAFAGVTALASATPREKAWAWVGRGVSAFAGSQGKAERARTVVKAELDFEEALKEDKDCADALINRAIAELWKGKESALDDADKYCKQAVTAAGKGPPSLDALSQFYVMRGVINMRRNRPDEAAAFFERAKAILPGWKEADNFQRLSALGAAVQKDLAPARRKELLKRCEGTAIQFGNMGMVLNALGVGWSLIKGEPEAEQQAYRSALQFLQKAMDTLPKEPTAYLNAAALKEDFIAALAGKLSGPVTGFKGETPPINKWLVGEAEVKRFPPQDKQILVDISRALKELEDIWQKYMDKAAAKPEEKLEAQLWLASCIRREAYLLEANQEREKIGLFDKALRMVKELATQNPANPQVQFALGQCFLDKEDYAHASAAYKAASAGGMKTPELARLLKGLDARLEILDTRPPKDRRALGQRPLIGGNLGIRASPGAIKTVGMKIDGKEVEPALCGMQVLYLPEDKEVFEGEPKVAISLTDTTGQTVNFPPFAISLNMKPPSWSVQGLIPGKAVFSIALESNAGIEFGTLRLELRESGKKSGRRVVLVSDGRCRIDMPDAKPERKKNSELSSDKFQVSAEEKNLVTPGDWDLVINVKDLNGNELTDSKTYTLK